MLLLTSLPNKILYDYFILVKDNDIDKCIKDIMKNEEFIKNKEYYMSNLNDIIKFINKCDNKLKKMSCGYCMKTYSFTSIKEHKCKWK